jgi:uncharacterized membrane protein YczE
LHRWRASPRRLAALLLGLFIFGAGEALLFASELGNSPWTVLAEGVADQTGAGVGATTVAISFLVLAMWIPLRQQPGIGTILNAIVIGVALGVTLDLLPHLSGMVLRSAAVIAGIGLVALGSGIYLACRLGAGPRDGLMVGLHRRTGLSIRLVRTGIELSVVVLGFGLGGTVGIGTLAFAVLIGPGVHAALALFSPVPAADL